ncbi:MAG TPA: CRISPR-associated endoribonuclease Cas6, partial [Anaerovoracaceae bacterium]|nr:CRISPR-associated endoribonuclease Cas6 [Anaerovoracaceae bacterium]
DMPILTESINIKMLSPLVLKMYDEKTDKDQYQDASSEDFQKSFVEVTEKQLKNMGLNISTEGLSIEAINSKRTVVSEFETKFAASIGTYMLHGNPELLNILYGAGIGHKRNAGFGLFSVVA